MIERKWVEGTWGYKLTGKHAVALLLGGLAVGLLVDVTALALGWFAIRGGRWIAGVVLMLLGVLFLLWVEAGLWRALKRAAKS